MGGFKKAVQTAANLGAVKKVEPQAAPQPPKPTTVEVSSSNAANADMDTSLAIKRKGRKATILTGSTGVLGGTEVAKKTLLG
jgi:hypothetical protein